MSPTQSAIHSAEDRLNHFDAGERHAALEELVAGAESGRIELPSVRPWFNLHCHSFFSYSGYGMSPSALVWKARTLGLEYVGLVDFDVLDGVEEFHAAGKAIGVKTIAAMETRVFIPEFETREINSPGEPGISYHMGSGFVSNTVQPATQSFADDLRARARDRNLKVIAAVNPYLSPVELDYEADVLPLTPNGVATERHLCEAYQRKAEAVIADRDQRIAFWSDKLGSDTAEIIDNAPKLQGLIRSKTMKRGGVGYQQPDADTFPAMTAVNEFVLVQNAIPMQTWLDGTSAGEQAIDELMDLQAASGVCAINIIPDRNWNISDPETKARKVANLHDVVRKADERGWPIQIGTELNAPGLKFVDDLDCPELAPCYESFLRGARILYGHSVDLGRGGSGYAKAGDRFTSVAEKNEHFARLGDESPAGATV